MNDCGTSALDRFAAELADYEILGAYEILGDPSASGQAKAAANALLEAVGPRLTPAPVLRQLACGHLDDRPRAALPVKSFVVPAGCTYDVVLSPQLPMRGPYWLGMTSADALVVAGVYFGMDCAFLSPGEVPGAFFDVTRPERLVPLAGRALHPGMQVRIVLRNVSCCAVEVALCLWGNDENSLRYEPAPARAAAAPAPAPAPVKLPPAPPPPPPKSAAELDHERRSELDGMASAAHALRQPYEPGDAWETPQDES